jgi:hypothetical protein
MKCVTMAVFADAARALTSVPFPATSITSPRKYVCEVPSSASSIGGGGSGGGGSGGGGGGGGGGVATTSTASPESSSPTCRTAVSNPIFRRLYERPGRRKWEVDRYNLCCGDYGPHRGRCRPGMGKPSSQARRRSAAAVDTKRTSADWGTKR